MTAGEDAGEGSREGGTKEQRVKTFRSALNNRENTFLPHKQLQPAKNVKPSSVRERINVVSVCVCVCVCVCSLACCLAVFLPIVFKCPLYSSLFVQEELECGNQSV